MELHHSLQPPLAQTEDLCSSQEVDLNVNYNEQFRNERVERTFSLRRNHLFDTVSKKSDSWPGNLEKSISSEQIISILNDPSHSKIKMLNTLPSTERSIVSIIAKDSKVWESFINIFEKLNDYNQTEDIVLIIHSISFLFPFADEDNQEMIVNSIVIYFLDLLENPKYMASILLLINVFSKSSTYARDSIICYGLHTFILNKIISSNSASTESEEIQMACYTISEIYSNPGEVDDEIIFDSIDPFFSLLSSNNQIKIKTAFHCLTNLINRKSCVADILFDKKVCNLVLNFFDHPDLVTCSLQFISSLVHNIAKIDPSLVLNDLLPRLFNLISNIQYISYVFRIFSNLIEKVSRSILPLLTDDFIRSAISLSTTAKATVKIEASYFLATCIMYFEPNRLKSFLQKDSNSCIDLLPEMIASGIREVILKCVLALTRVILVFSEEQYVYNIISALEENGVIKDLTNLLEEENDNLLNHSIINLMNKINSLCNENNAS